MVWAPTRGVLLASPRSIHRQTFGLPSIFSPAFATNSPTPDARSDYLHISRASTTSLVSIQIRAECRNPVVATAVTVPPSLRPRLPPPAPHHTSHITRLHAGIPSHTLPHRDSPLDLISMILPLHEANGDAVQLLDTIIISQESTPTSSNNPHDSATVQRQYNYCWSPKPTKASPTAVRKS